MIDSPNKASKKKNVIYWVVTILLALGMLAGGTGQILRFPFNVTGVTHLGYPVYFTSLIGTWKILGVVAILIPGYPLLKEWAYAGFFFAMTGAVTSHLISGDKFTEWLAPGLFAGLTIASWALRPTSRKIMNKKLQSYSNL